MFEELSAKGNWEPQSEGIEEEDAQEEEVKDHLQWMYASDSMTGREFQCYLKPCAIRALVALRILPCGTLPAVLY